MQKAMVYFVARKKLIISITSFTVKNRLFFKTGESYWNKFEGFALTAFGSKPKDRLEEISCTPAGDSQSSLERKLATLQNKNLVVKLA